MAYRLADWIRQRAALADDARPVIRRATSSARISPRERVYDVRGSLAYTRGRSPDRVRERVARDLNQDDCDANPVSPIALYESRVDMYHSFNSYLDNIQDDVAVCDLNRQLFPCQKQIGSASVYGVIYRLYNKRGNPLLPSDIVVKKMEDTRGNRKEIEYALLFTEDILNRKSPHFVMTWESKICPSAGGNKILLFSELFPGGDLNKFNEYLADQPRSAQVKLTLSMIFQVFMGLWNLFRHGLTHDDLHGGNVLFKKIQDPASHYFVYTTPDNRRMAIQHQSHLFALTDYGLMKEAQTVEKKGVITNLDIYEDFGRICEVMSDIVEADFPHLAKLLMDMSKIAAEANQQDELVEPFDFLAGSEDVRSGATMIDVIVKNNVMPEWEQVVVFQRPRANRITEIFDMR